LLLIAGAVLLAGCKKSDDSTKNIPAPQNAAGHKQDFTMVEYYDMPSKQTQMKSRLSGAEAQPLPGGLLVVKQLVLETFNPDGSTQAVVGAPECIYDMHDMQNRTANSAGHLRLQSGDGKISTEGDGFLWRQDDSFLTISNHVYTLIKTSALKPTKP
jgi:hypothetical protein